MPMVAPTFQNFVRSRMALAKIATSENDEAISLGPRPKMMRQNSLVYSPNAVLHVFSRSDLERWAT